MTDMVAIGFAGHHIDFNLDHEACSWTPIDAHAADLLHESSFPLIAITHGCRYELYSDGTFAEVDH